MDECWNLTLQHRTTPMDQQLQCWSQVSFLADLHSHEKNGRNSFPEDLSSLPWRLQKEFP